MRRSWFGTVTKQNKQPSVDLLKSLYGVLVKNTVVTENNRTLIVEVLRSIAECVIWGDQNDPRVFDYFLEKGVQSYFLSIIEQPKCGTYVCTQLLQTLNILFENIRNETSIYFLLSNNHVNSIICHEFDFSDEEIMAYYISFLKTLSLKLNLNTIHFFYNEHLRDFPLYTEAIKFFNHTESMVRIAVRTLTLNVYRVGDETTLKFIHDKTSAPYFSNLVWFIGNNVLMMERCLRTEANHLTRNKLESLVALHLDDIHYVHDIMQLQIQSLNTMLCDHLLNTLFIPLYVYSLDPSLKVDSPQVSVKCALFLLSQVFLIMSHAPLVKQLKLYICFEENPHLESSDTLRRFAKPFCQIQDSLKPAVIPKNKQNLQPTRLAKEHKQELKAREAKRLQEESRAKDLERYSKKTGPQTDFNQTGYLKSILEPDQGTDPLLGTKVHRIDSLKKLNNDDARSRESSSVSKEGSVYSEAIFIDSEDCKTESFTDLLLSVGDESKSSGSTKTPDLKTPDPLSPGPATPDPQTPDPRSPNLTPADNGVANLQDDNQNDYAVSEDSGIVSSETMENIAQVIDDEDNSNYHTDETNNNTDETNNNIDETNNNTDETQQVPVTSGETDTIPNQPHSKPNSPELESSESTQTLNSTSRQPSDATENSSFDNDTIIRSVSEKSPVSDICEPAFQSPTPESPVLSSLDFQSSDLPQSESSNTTTQSLDINTLSDSQAKVSECAAGQQSNNKPANLPVTDNAKTFTENYRNILENDKSVLENDKGVTENDKAQTSHTTSSPGKLFTPTKLAEESHFADAFHCTPTRSCIFYDALLSCLELGEDDTEALFSAALLYAMFTNKSMPHKPTAPYYYDDRIIDRLLNILEKACHPESIVRLVTVEIAVRLLTVLTTYDNKIFLQDHHIAVLTAVKENSVRHLRVFYTGEDDTLFIELFDEEYRQLGKRKETNMAYLMSDECMLLGPVYTPLTGIEFTKRLPCGDIEKMRKSLIVFFTIRKLWQTVMGEEEQDLPLLNLSLQVSQGDILNLNNSDLIACSVVTDNDLFKRFLVIDTHQLILVEPDNAPGRLGWGIVQFVAPLQHVDAKPEKDNNRNLLINIEKTASSKVSLRATFHFEDHIRCFAAKTRLKQGRESLQKLKGFKLSRILDIQDRFIDEPYLTSSRAPLAVYKANSGYDKSPPEIGKSKATLSRILSNTQNIVSEDSHTIPTIGPQAVPTTISRVPSGPTTPGNSRKSFTKLPDPEVV